MRVLVTGHNGYIGGVLVPILQDAGHEIVGMDTGLFDAGRFVPEPPQVECVPVDVRDARTEHFVGFDAVIHLAGISNDPLGDLDADVTFDINHRGSARVACAAKEAGVRRFLQSSSCSLYGSAGDELLDESAEFNPVTPYGVSKVLAEESIRALADDEFHPTFLRNATAYGVAPHLRIDLVVNNLAGFAVTTGEVLLKSNGLALRPLVHVRDISRAFLAVLEAPLEAVSGEAFNVGRSGENYRIRDVAKIVEEVVPGSRVRFADEAGADIRNYRVDCDKLARAVPDFAPQWTVRAGVEELVAAYTAFGLTLDDVVGPRFLRIHAVEELIDHGRLGADLRWRATESAPSLTGGGVEATTPCRGCGKSDLRAFLSLGSTPLADALLDAANLGEPEPRYPLDVGFCPHCSLVQILETVPPGRLFVDNYHYFSSYSDALLTHAREHATRLVAERHLGPNRLVVELASNDGYLLRNFVEAGIPVLGIDPSPGPARAAMAAGIPTRMQFFGAALAREMRDEGERADVIIANNVMAHVPDLNGFVEGIGILLADDGIATIENPCVSDLVDHCEFDTIYHEHHCYFSCTSVARLMERHGLVLNDVEYFPELHGGTMRWTVSHGGGQSTAVRQTLARERDLGVAEFEYYASFGSRVAALRDELRALLVDLRGGGATIAAYGAAAKGATLCNYANIGRDLVSFVVDRNEHKQGRYMPGTHQPIFGPDALLELQPDYVLLLAWNFRHEIMAQQAEYARRGGQFIVPVPWPQITTGDAPIREPVAG